MSGGGAGRPIIGLADTDASRTDVIRALVRGPGSRLFGDTKLFRASVRRERPDCVILGSRDPHGGPTCLVAGRLRRDHPQIAMIAVCDMSTASVKELLYLARAGIDEVVLTPLASRTELAAALERARSRRRGNSVWRQIAPLVPDAFHDLFQFCLLHAHERCSVGSLAEYLGIDRSTLAARLARAGLPTAHAILSWARLIAVSDQIASARLPVELAALSAGFESAAALRRFTKRLVG